MAVLLSRKSLVLAKIESSYGTDPTPTASANALEVYDLAVNIIEDAKKRPASVMSLSHLKELSGKVHAEVTFTTYVRTSGTAGTAARQGVLFQAAGLEDTISSGVSVAYAPNATPTESVTLYCYKDGIRHIVSGAIGDYEIDLTAGEFGMCNWTLKGVYALPTDASPSSPTFDSGDPIITKGATMTIGGYTAIIEKLNIKSSNTIAERTDFNQSSGIKGFQITGRDYEGTMTIEAVLRATTYADFWSYFNSNTEKVLAYSIGSANNQFDIDASQVRFRPPKYGDRDGILTFDLDFQLAASSSLDDEITITYA